ncbi:cytochrome c oxidase accessory protein CcoG [Tahibacter soli]|uniref:Cytochrome c oxidase accessory protein CcoG n=1 Tax=Tahibacter soli TaxID=2983605 RepID=A0A9X3YI44_9GAMM|nr:cytochrome c oxidase accessory protein CcoG [Tahibacter soli]MDC8012607.1 cytochrome c oxidase accessory protein CcoG [Tahibacter soli]
MNPAKKPKTIELALVGGDADLLYARQPKVYPREIDGRYTRLRVAAVFWLLGMFYAFPWLSWDGRQAVLFDLPARKFYILGLTFWPQDFFYMTWLLVMAGLALFFFTALAGRLWCGYACPQTVWTEVFLWIERRVEGDRNRRMKLDAGPWTREKIVRKSAKQFLWIAFALWTGFTFVGFFTPIRELASNTAALSLSGWEAFWIAFYGFATYGNAGYLREQVCKYMCPYARFQGAMFDRDTLVISYDAARGEPRGGRRRGADPASLDLGDCIDCNVCVQVCPTGIDIRHGLQVGCIACAACIDACDAVMDKMQYRRGLIRYTTERALAGGRTRVLRPRIVFYAFVLAALAAGLAWSLSHRSLVLAEVIRDRNALWREGRGGSVENSYTLKIVNKSDRALHLSATVRAPFALEIVGASGFAVEPSAVAAIPLTLRAIAPPAGRHDVTLELVEEATNPKDAATVRVVTRYFAPEPNP